MGLFINQSINHSIPMQYTTSYARISYLANPPAPLRNSSPLSDSDSNVEVEECSQMCSVLYGVDIVIHFIPEKVKIKHLDFRHLI